MEIIHLAQPALHRLGTDEAASKGRPGKQRWREAEAAPAGPGRWWEHRGVCTVGFGRGRYQRAKQQQGGLSGAAAGGQHGPLTSHRLRAAPQNQNPGNKKGEFERFGPKYPLCTEQVPAEPCQPWALQSPPGAHSCQQELALLWHKKGTLASAARPPRGLSPPALPLPQNSLAAPRAVLRHQGSTGSTGLLLGGGPGLPGNVPLQGHPWGQLRPFPVFSSAPRSTWLSLGWFSVAGMCIEAPPLRAGGVSPSPQERCLQPSRTRGGV